MYQGRAWSKQIELDLYTKAINYILIMLDYKFVPYETSDDVTIIGTYDEVLIGDKKYLAGHPINISIIKQLLKIALIKKEIKTAAKTQQENLALLFLANHFFSLSKQAQKIPPQNILDLENYNLQQLLGLTICKFLNCLNSGMSEPILEKILNKQGFAQVKLSAITSGSIASTVQERIAIFIRNLKDINLEVLKTKALYFKIDTDTKYSNAMLFHEFRGRLFEHFQNLNRSDFKHETLIENSNNLIIAIEKFANIFIYELYNLNDVIVKHEKHLPEISLLVTQPKSEKPLIKKLQQLKKFLNDKNLSVEEIFNALTNQNTANKMHFYYALLHKINKDGKKYPIDGHEELKKMITEITEEYQFECDLITFKDYQKIIMAKGKAYEKLPAYIQKRNQNFLEQIEDALSGYRLITKNQLEWEKFVDNNLHKLEPQDRRHALELIKQYANKITSALEESQKKQVVLFNKQSLHINSILYQFGLPQLKLETWEKTSEDAITVIYNQYGLRSDERYPNVIRSNQFPVLDKEKLTMLHCLAMRAFDLKTVVYLAFYHYIHSPDNRSLSGSFFSLALDSGCSPEQLIVIAKDLQAEIQKTNSEIKFDTLIISLEFATCLNLKKHIENISPKQIDSSYYEQFYDVKDYLFFPLEKDKKLKQQSFIVNTMGKIKKTFPFSQTSLSTLQNAKATIQYVNKDANTQFDPLGDNDSLDTPHLPWKLLSFTTRIMEKESFSIEIKKISEILNTTPEIVRKALSEIPPRHLFLLFNGTNDDEKLSSAISDLEHAYNQERKEAFQAASITLPYIIQKYLIATTAYAKYPSGVFESQDLQNIQESIRKINKLLTEKKLCSSKTSENKLEFIKGSQDSISLSSKHNEDFFELITNLVLITNHINANLPKNQEEVLQFEKNNLIKSIRQTIKKPERQYALTITKNSILIDNKEISFKNLTDAQVSYLIWHVTNEKIEFKNAQDKINLLFYICAYYQNLALSTNDYSAYDDTISNLLRFALLEGATSEKILMVIDQFYYSGNDLTKTMAASARKDKIRIRVFGQNPLTSVEHDIVNGQNLDNIQNLIRLKIDVSKYSYFTYEALFNGSLKTYFSNPSLLNSQQNAKLLFLRYALEENNKDCHPCQYALSQAYAQFQTKAKGEEAEVAKALEIYWLKKALENNFAPAIEQLIANLFQRRIIQHNNRLNNFPVVSLHHNIKFANKLINILQIDGHNRSEFRNLKSHLMMLSSQNINTNPDALWVKLEPLLTKALLKAYEVYQNEYPKLVKKLKKNIITDAQLARLNSVIDYKYASNNPSENVYFFRDRFNMLVLRKRIVSLMNELQEMPTQDVHTVQLGKELNTFIMSTLLLTEDWYHMLSACEELEANFLAIRNINKNKKVFDQLEQIKAAPDLNLFSPNLNKNDFIESKIIALKEKLPDLAPKIVTYLTNPAIDKSTVVKGLTDKDFVVFNKLIENLNKSYSDEIYRQFEMVVSQYKALNRQLIDRRTELGKSLSEKERTALNETVKIATQDNKAIGYLFDETQSSLQLNNILIQFKENLQTELNQDANTLIIKKFISANKILTQELELLKQKDLKDLASTKPALLIKISEAIKLYQVCKEKKAGLEDKFFDKRITKLINFQTYLNEKDSTDPDFTTNMIRGQFLVELSLTHIGDSIDLKFSKLLTIISDKNLESFYDTLSVSWRGYIMSSSSLTLSTYIDSPAEAMLFETWVSKELDTQLNNIKDNLHRLVKSVDLKLILQEDYESLSLSQQELEKALKDDFNALSQLAMDKNEFQNIYATIQQKTDTFQKKLRSAYGNAVIKKLADLSQQEQLSDCIQDDYFPALKATFIEEENTESSTVLSSSPKDQPENKVFYFPFYNFWKITFQPTIFFNDTNYQVQCHYLALKNISPHRENLISLLNSEAHIKQFNNNQNIKHNLILSLYWLEKSALEGSLDSVKTLLNLYDHASFSHHIPIETKKRIVEKLLALSNIQIKRIVTDFIESGGLTEKSLTDRLDERNKTMRALFHQDIYLFFNDSAILSSGMLSETTAPAYSPKQENYKSTGEFLREQTSYQRLQLVNIVDRYERENNRIHGLIQNNTEKEVESDTVIATIYRQLKELKKKSKDLEPSHPVEANQATLAEFTNYKVKLGCATAILCLYEKCTALLNKSLDESELKNLSNLLTLVLANNPTSEKDFIVNPWKDLIQALRGYQVKYHSNPKIYAALKKIENINADLIGLPYINVDIKAKFNSNISNASESLRQTLQAKNDKLLLAQSYVNPETFLANCGSLITSQNEHAVLQKLEKIVEVHQNYEEKHLHYNYKHIKHDLITLSKHYSTMLPAIILANDNFKNNITTLKDLKEELKKWNLIIDTPNHHPWHFVFSGQELDLAKVDRTSLARLVSLMSKSYYALDKNQDLQFNCPGDKKAKIIQEERNKLINNISKDISFYKEFTVIDKTFIKQINLLNLYLPKLNSINPKASSSHYEFENAIENILEAQKVYDAAQIFVKSKAELIFRYYNNTILNRLSKLASLGVNIKELKKQYDKLDKEFNEKTCEIYSDFILKLNDQFEDTLIKKFADLEKKFKNQISRTIKAFDQLPDKLLSNSNYEYDKAWTFFVIDKGFFIESVETINIKDFLRDLNTPSAAFKQRYSELKQNIDTICNDLNRAVLDDQKTKKVQQALVEQQKLTEAAQMKAELEKAATLKRLEEEKQARLLAEEKAKIALERETQHKDAKKLYENAETKNKDILDRFVNLSKDKNFTEEKNAIVKTLSETISASTSEDKTSAEIEAYTSARKQLEDLTKRATSELTTKIKAKLDIPLLNYQASVKKKETVLGEVATDNKEVEVAFSAFLVTNLTLTSDQLIKKLIEVDIEIFKKQQSSLEEVLTIAATTNENYITDQLKAAKTLSDEKLTKLSNSVAEINKIASSKVAFDYAQKQIALQSAAQSIPQLNNFNEGIEQEILAINGQAKIIAIEKLTPLIDAFKTTVTSAKTLEMQNEAAGWVEEVGNEISISSTQLENETTASIAESLASQSDLTKLVESCKKATEKFQLLTPKANERIIIVKKEKADQFYDDQKTKFQNTLTLLESFDDDESKSLITNYKLAEEEQTSTLQKGEKLENINQASNKLIENKAQEILKTIEESCAIAREKNTEAVTKNELAKRFYCEPTEFESVSVNSLIQLFSKQDKAAMVNILKTHEAIKTEITKEKETKKVTSYNESIFKPSSQTYLARLEFLAKVNKDEAKKSFVTITKTLQDEEQSFLSSNQVSHVNELSPDKQLALLQQKVAIYKAQIILVDKASTDTLTLSIRSLIETYQSLIQPANRFKLKPDVAKLKTLSTDIISINQDNEINTSSENISKALLEIKDVEHFKATYDTLITTLTESANAANRSLETEAERVERAYHSAKSTLDPIIEKIEKLDSNVAIGFKEQVPTLSKPENSTFAELIDFYQGKLGNLPKKDMLVRKGKEILGTKQKQFFNKLIESPTPDNPNITFNEIKVVANQLGIPLPKASLAEIRTQFTLDAVTDALWIKEADNIISNLEQVENAIQSTLTQVHQQIDNEEIVKLETDISQQTQQLDELKQETRFWDNASVTAFEQKKNNQTDPVSEIEPGIVSDKKQQLREKAEGLASDIVQITGIRDTAQNSIVGRLVQNIEQCNKELRKKCNQHLSRSHINAVDGNLKTETISQYYIKDNNDHPGYIDSNKLIRDLKAKAKSTDVVGVDEIANLEAEIPNFTGKIELAGLEQQIHDEKTTQAEQSQVQSAWTEDSDDEEEVLARKPFKSKVVYPTDNMSLTEKIDFSKNVLKEEKAKTKKDQSSTETIIQEKIAPTFTLLDEIGIEGRVTVGTITADDNIILPEGISNDTVVTSDIIIKLVQNNPAQGLNIGKQLEEEAHRKANSTLERIDNSITKNIAILEKFNSKLAQKWQKDFAQQKQAERDSASIDKLSIHRQADAKLKDTLIEKAADLYEEIKTFFDLPEDVIAELSEDKKEAIRKIKIQLGTVATKVSRDGVNEELKRLNAQELSPVLAAIAATPALNKQVQVKILEIKREEKTLAIQGKIARLEDISPKVGKKYKDDFAKLLVKANEIENVPTDVKLDELNRQIAYFGNQLEPLEKKIASELHSQLREKVDEYNKVLQTAETEKFNVGEFNKKENVEQPSPLQVLNINQDNPAATIKVEDVVTEVLTVKDREDFKKSVKALIKYFEAAPIALDNAIKKEKNNKKELMQEAKSKVAAVVAEIDPETSLGKKAQKSWSKLQKQIETQPQSQTIGELKQLTDKLNKLTEKINKAVQENPNCQIIPFSAEHKYEASDTFSIYYYPFFVSLHTALGKKINDKDQTEIDTDILTLRNEIKNISTTHRTANNDKLEKQANRFLDLSRFDKFQLSWLSRLFLGFTSSFSENSRAKLKQHKRAQALQSFLYQTLKKLERVSSEAANDEALCKDVSTEKTMKALQQAQVNVMQNNRVIIQDKKSVAALKPIEVKEVDPTLDQDIANVIKQPVNEVQDKFLLQVTELEVKVKNLIFETNRSQLSGHLAYLKRNGDIKEFNMAKAKLCGQTILTKKGKGPLVINKDQTIDGLDGRLEKLRVALNEMFKEQNEALKKRRITYEEHEKIIRAHLKNCARIFTEIKSDYYFFTEDSSMIPSYRKPGTTQSTW